MGVNGWLVAEVELSEQWRSVQIEVPAESVRAGINVVTLEWPVPAADWRPRLARSLEAIDAGQVPDLTAHFGEISGFLAKLPTPATEM